MAARTSFVRVLGRRDVLALAFGAMIGWSWVILSGEWIRTAGGVGAVVAFAVGGSAMALVGLTYAELASAMPVAGGEHAYSLRALGRRASFVCTWALVLGYASVVAFEAVALPTVIDHLAPGLRSIPLWSVAGSEVDATGAALGVGVALAVTWLNARGVRPAARVQAGVTLLILLGGALLFTGALTHEGLRVPEPLFVDGFAGLSAVLVMVPFLFVGFDVVPQAAEEIDLPFRDLGRLLLVAVGLAVLWYAAITAAVAGVLPQERIESASLATAEAGATVWGGAWASHLLVLAGAAGILTSWNAFLVGGSRALYAMARSGMLPESLGRLHPRHRTPHRAIWLLGALSCASPWLGRSALVWFVNVGALGIVVAYAMVALSFLVLRRREPEMARPFRVPAGRFVGGAALVVSLGLGVLCLPGSPAALAWPEEWAIVAGWVALGALLHVRRPKARG